ncbi:hypothetical protein [Nostoc sp.]
MSQPKQSEILIVLLGLTLGLIALFIVFMGELGLIPIFSKNVSTHESGKDTSLVIHLAPLVHAKILQLQL